MAIVNLPYPSMDFVPLDILTADELDHIVANIEAVNNVNVPKYRVATSGSITLPVGDYTHHVNMLFSFTSATSTGGTGLRANSAFTGTTKTHRVMVDGNETAINNLDNADGNTFLYLSTGNAIGTSSGRVYAEGDIVVNGNKVYCAFNFHTATVTCSGVSTSEATLRSTSQVIDITPYRTNGTASLISASVISTPIV